MKQNYDNDYEDFDPDDGYTPMSPERDPYDSDEDHIDKLQSLYGDEGIC
ncbi:hypothetical protein [Parabacteroides distasonis]|nr:hypothetical protein [Parabacteroides distasonis]MDB9154233.1 hypothetical protein [Parabacteroides distasonis]MDB9158741.1 hypothetical protein [Parabacteroides distasonis]MDB9167519.1 hypothetical protein [Parabacteroides distasonis]MDB9172048.1 hypothetical protein [Parabacteroides distasonis]MDB9196635.1 hypothetical protein [Parabacteroides distasonis]